MAALRLRPCAVQQGEEGNTFHIIAQGQVEVYRDGQRVAQLGAGTSVGEMAYLAPSPALRIHSADVIVSEPSTTISFTPQLLEQLSLGTRRLFDTAFIRVLVRRLACRARGAGASAPDSLSPDARGPRRDGPRIATLAAAFVVQCAAAAPPPMIKKPEERR